MDESWNFLKEAPESELALVIDACKKSSIDVPVDASASDIVDRMSKMFNDTFLSYEQFLDEVCRQNALSNIDEFSVEDKGLELLEFFLAKGIESMSEDQIIRFAFDYCFSNLDKEKLIREVGVRLKTSNMFEAKLYHIVPVLFGIDFTNIFPSDVASLDVTGLNVMNSDIGVKYAPIASTLITLRNEHHISNNCDYIAKYIDKIIQNNDNKKNILAVMLAIVKMKVNDQDRDSILEEVASFLANEPLSIPDYILNKIPVVDVTNSIMIHFMKQLFPCTMDLQGCYRKMNHELGDTISTIAFFDYKFPYSKVSKLAVSYYRIPDDEIGQKAIMLYLLLSGMDNPKQHLKCENEMKMMNVDYAVVSHEQNIVLKSPKKIVYTEDFLIDHWKDYFDEIEKRPDSIQFEGIMNYLSLFADNRYNSISANLKNIVDRLSIKGYPGFEQLKLILQKIIGQAKVLSNEVK